METSKALNLTLVLDFEHWIEVLPQSFGDMVTDETVALVCKTLVVSSLS